MLLLDIDQDSRQRTGMKVRQSSTSLRFAGQKVRYVWRERGSARSGRGWSSSKRGCCCSSMSRPRLRCRCCFHVPKLASCQLELLRRRHARNQLNQDMESSSFPFVYQISNKFTTISFSATKVYEYFLDLLQRPTRTYPPIHFSCVSTNTCIFSLTERKA